MRRIPVVVVLAMALPALAQQPKVSDGATPPASPPPPRAAPADDKGTPPSTAASRSEKARQALKAMRGGDSPARPKAPPPDAAGK